MDEFISSLPLQNGFATAVAIPILWQGQSSTCQYDP